MCLGVPAKVKKIEGEWGWLDVNQLLLKINLSLVPGVKIGDYVIIHAGFAIQKLSAEEGESTLELFKQILEIDEK
ncbi:MAG: hypothetical protein RBG1_1C00001G0044 [candidate division Zixibacteria bacterium RBG-1]|nr:MAG: hypothetical protein RBG1_1C00001G0044 [candidate division Zixibacteria bacterium RBG-1]OGC83821.1 MAG: hypothetical protein A2V73_00315 [candidate division Zixibacteria bacterium RBG_19FT_COMBO_42_43]